MMEHIKLDLSKVTPFVSKEEIQNYKPQVEEQIQKLHNGTGMGNDFLGWLKLPSTISQEHIDEINKTASDLQDKIDLLVVIGIGGSYLGAKSVLDALSSHFEYLRQYHRYPMILFAGNNLGEDYLHELRRILSEKSYAIVVVSKSGTTTEPAVAFRILKQDTENKYGHAEAKNRIIAITDDDSGALRKMSDKLGYKSFIIPDDIGGRYSLLTPAGLLPIAVAGIDIEQLIDGARQMEQLTGPEVPFEKNIAGQYAAVRNILYNLGKKIEILAYYDIRLQYLAEWWKQLYGESEGKNNKGIYPDSMKFTTDLHSLGQYIQEGERNIFETVLSVKETNNRVTIPADDSNLDGLNFLDGKRVDEINKMAEIGTTLAHVEGKVPNIRIEIPYISEYYMGELTYFFEKACAISGYLLGVNPFNQPGVEAYKKNMYALLKKPGYEKEYETVMNKIREMEEKVQ